MRPSGNLAALFSGVVLIACLSGCASVPRAETGRTGRDSVIATGPPTPQALRSERQRNGFVIDLVPALKKTGHVLLDIASLVLPEPASHVQFWTHGFDYGDSLTGFDRDGDGGSDGCIANTAIAWCPFYLAP